MYDGRDEGEEVALAGSGAEVWPDYSDPYDHQNQVDTCTVKICLFLFIFIKFYYKPLYFNHFIFDSVFLLFIIMVNRKNHCEKLFLSFRTDRSGQTV